MPVIRKREHISSDFSQRQVDATGVTRGAASVAQAMETPIRTMGNMAAGFARAMAETSEAEAVRLAKTAVFSQDENGVPQMPEETWSRMGNIARRSYDANIEDKMLEKLQTNWTAQANEAFNNNLEDRAAFNEDLEARQQQMLGSLPPAFHGAFQQMVNGTAVEMNARLGHAQAVYDNSVRRDELLATVPAVIQTAGEHLAAGNHELAGQTIARRIEEIEANPRMSVPAREKAINDMVVGFAKERIYSDMANGWGADGPTASQLVALAGDLSVPPGEMDPELRKYFQVPGRDEDRSYLADRAKGLANQLLQEANMKDSATSSQAKVTTGMQSAYVGGDHEWNGAMQRQFDIEVGGAARLDRPMTSADLLAMASEVDPTTGDLSPELTAALEVTKSIGKSHLPPSVEGAINTAYATREEPGGQERLAGALAIYRYLNDGLSSRGTNENLTTQFDKETQRYFNALSVRTKHGSPLNSEILTLNQEFQNPRDLNLSARLLTEGIDAEEWNLREKAEVTPENYENQMKMYVRRNYAPPHDRPASQQELEEAQAVFDAQIGTMGAEKAMDMVNEMVGRKYATDRSTSRRYDDSVWSAPEGFDIPLPAEDTVDYNYPQPEARTIWEGIFQRDAAGDFKTEDGKVERPDPSNFLGLVGENIVDIPFFFANMFSGEDLFDPQFGVDRGRMNFTEAYMSQEIHKLVEAHGGDYTPAPLVNEILGMDTALVPGEHYVAVKDERGSQGRKKPVFGVKLRGKNDQWIWATNPDGTKWLIDPNKVHKAEQDATHLYEMERAIRVKEGGGWTTSEIAADPVGYANYMADIAERAGYSTAARRIRNAVN